MVKFIRVPFLLVWPPKRFSTQVLLPNIVFVRQDVDLSASSLAHELAHIDQIRRMGFIRYWAGYLLNLARHGYYDHPYEQEARAASTDSAYLARARDLLKGVK